MDSEHKVFSLNPIIDTRSQVLILGSMPGKESLAKNQYYANPRNQFWEIVFSILELEIPPDYRGKVAVLKEHKIALWDVIHECERTGSLDSSIEQEEPNNFQGLFEFYPNIQFVGFNGSKVFNVFRRQIGLGILSGIEIGRFPSTSPTPGKNVKSYGEKIKDWGIIKKYLTS